MGIIQTEFYFGLFVGTELQKAEMCEVFVDSDCADQLQNKFPDTLKLVWSNTGRAIDQQEYIPRFLATT
jgi:hypothetical protein